MVDCILGRGHDFRMAIQSEIIVTRKIQQRLPVNFGMRAGKAVERIVLDDKIEAISATQLRRLGAEL